MLIPGMTDTAKFIFMFVLILIFTVINLLGIEEVGKVSTIFSVIIFIAFMAVTVVGFANWQYNPCLLYTSELLIYCWRSQRKRENV